MTTELPTHCSGPENAPAILLVHGLGGSARAWDRVVPLLEDRFRVVAVDLPGAGASPPLTGTVTIEAMADLLPAALDAVGASRAIVVGHSMGGVIATALAERHAARIGSLVLVNAPPSRESRLAAGSGTERLLRLPVLGPLLWRAAPAARHRDGLRTAFGRGTEVPDRFVDDLRATAWGVWAGETAAIDAYLDARPLSGRLEVLGRPVTVIAGTQDERVRPDALRALGEIPDVTFVPIEEAGHSPIWEEPETMARLIAAAASR